MISAIEVGNVPHAAARVCGQGLEANLRRKSKTYGCNSITAGASLLALLTMASFAMIERTALRKLKHLDLARRLDDLRAPPGNRLEPVAGDHRRQWSIRVNDVTLGVPTMSKRLKAVAPGEILVEDFLKPLAMSK